jgi:hypothetical protein
MTRAEAEQRATALNLEHPDRGIYRWMAREGEDGWQVARITVPGGVRPGPLHEAVESRPQPEAPDPRTSYDRNVGGPWVGT